MWMLIRTTLIWLMAIALPVQGAAGATMLACGPDHHGAAAAHSHAAGDPVHEHGDVMEPHIHAEGHAALGHADTGYHGHDRESPSGSESAAADGNDVHKAAGKCSACASCCTVAVLPTSVLPIGSPPAVDRVVAFFQTQAAVYMTGGPERPPRTILA
jgi:hypothetical protein